ncbi:hypothetical protein H9Q70_009466 [Fusarium xylarioides]|nr:hypothetical protein H9Q70_009466 [Fusarium xylarioides]KAG5776803.1 hypothetical protein H9Q73_009518 [Fusarium xylarioides]KAG5804017.1 hypothetical protein H9Q71_011398 [Fusarium xylarioides]KAG5816103.1 hypothetical protein H9Q74_011289 [Fusarium xylarioides]
MADPNESSQFLLQPLNFDTSSSPAPSTGYDIAQSDISDGRRDEATSAASGDHGHNEATGGWDNERGTEACNEITGLLIREAGNNDNASSAKNHQRNILLVWSLELGLLLLAAGLLGSIFAILGAYDTDELPDWSGKIGAGITLNALVAVIATIFRATIAFVALEVLAQLKWDWITKTFRPVGDMQRYDDASRGAWGSFMLLPVVFKHQPQAIVAVIVVVTSLAIGPVTQQAIQPYYCAQIAPGRLATITVATELDDNRLYYQERPSMWKLHVGLEAAIQDAVVNPSQSANIDDLFNCPSGNCTFHPYPDHPEQPDQDRVSYASLGMCSRCEDISKLVKIRVDRYSQTDLHQAILSMDVPSQGNESDRIEISSGTSSQSARYLESKITEDFWWADKALPRDFLNTARWSAANLTILAFSQQNCQNETDGSMSCPLVGGRDKAKGPVAWDQPTGYIAAACILYPCIKHYSGTVRLGSLSERVVRSTPLRVQIPKSLEHSSGGHAANQVPQGLSGVQYPCFVNGTLYTSTNMTSESEKLPEDARQNVFIHPEGWENHSLHEAVDYRNVTAPRECVVSLRHLFIYSLRRSLSEAFNAYCRPEGYQTKFVSCYTATEGSSLPMVSILRPRSTSIETISESMNVMAMRLTTEFRRAGLDAYGNSRPVVEGQGWENRSCLRVAWEWLVLPAVLLSMCIVSMGWLIISDLLSRGNVVVWKGSILPFLLNYKVPTLEKMGLEELDLAGKKFEIKLER